MVAAAGSILVYLFEYAKIYKPEEFPTIWLWVKKTGYLKNPTLVK